MDSADATANEALSSPQQKAATAPPTKYLSWLTISFMTVSAVASVRAAPAMAEYGLAAIFLLVIPAIVFLLPTALIAAELASGWDGGVYNWVRQGISPEAGFVAVWTQFAMTLTYYPSLLAYVASTLAYVFNPQLASNGYYTAAVILVVYWVSTMVSMRGLSVVARLSSGGLVLGTLIPGSTLILLGIIYLLQGNQSAAPMTPSHVLPTWTGIASLVLIVNNFLSYAGMEVNAVHVDDLRNPAKEYPRAMFVAIIMVVAIFVLPALAISWIIPAKQLTLTAGVMQAFNAIFAHFGIPWVTSIFGIMLITASLGGMMAWLAGPSKGLLKIAQQEGYLPPVFQKVNKDGIQQNILIAQGFVISLIALAYVFIPNVQTSYWMFSVITTQVYLIMYALMFVAAIRLRRTQPDHPRGYRVPGLTLVGVVGLISSAMAFSIGFIAPSQFGGASPVLYFFVILAGAGGIGLLVPCLFLKLRKPSWKQVDAETAPRVAA